MVGKASKLMLNRYALLIVDIFTKKVTVVPVEEKIFLISEMH